MPVSMNLTVDGLIDAVNRDIPFDRACIIGCGVMTGVGAVVRKAKVSPGASVVVIGCGAVGLNALQGAKLVGSGAGTVINPFQGCSVSLSADGSTAIVGGYRDSGGGAAWVWTRSGGVWTQPAIDPQLGMIFSIGKLQLWVP